MLLRAVRSVAVAAANRRYSGIPAAGTSTAPKTKKYGAVSLRDTLRSTLLSLFYPKFSAEEALRKWKEEGRRIETSELNLAVRDLRKRKRFKHALEIYEWMAKQRDITLRAKDYATHLELLVKARGISIAEKFFENIPVPMLDHNAYSTLIQSYLRLNFRSRAEALVAKMLESNLVKNPSPYNHMLSFYAAKGEPEKVPELILELKRSTPPDIVTYNIWLSCCARRNDVEAAEKVFSNLKEARLSPDWLTHSTLANLYVKNGLDEKAMEALEKVEETASERDRAAYSSLLSLRTRLGDGEGVQRVWERMKTLFPRMNDSEYMCMISSLLKFKELKRAENLYAEWESVSRNRDPRIPNALLAAFVNVGETVKAKELHERMARNGVEESYTTFELLARVYSKEREAEKAFCYFEAALKSVAKWKPSETLAGEVLGLVEEEGNIEWAERLLEALRRAGYSSTGIYNSVLRTYEKAGKMPLLVKERMKSDGVEMDEETCELITTTRDLCVSDVSSVFLRPCNSNF